MRVLSVGIRTREALEASERDTDPLVLVLWEVASGPCAEEGRRQGDGGTAAPVGEH